MPMPAILHDDRIDRLAELLDRRAVPFKGLGLEALDGFLSALVLGPEAVPDDEWMSVVWGGKPPRWDDDDEASEVALLLREHRELAAQRVRHDGMELPPRLAPLLWLPEDPGSAQPDLLDVGRDWALGFFRGVELREAAWETWLDEHDWIEAIFNMLDRIASGEVLSDDPTGAATPLDYRERMDIIAALPGMLADLQHHRIAMLTPRVPLRRAETPERNDPCPCNSGRKFKKCCGA
jgi:uncharacterized protein